MWYVIDDGSFRFRMGMAAAIMAAIAPPASLPVPNLSLVWVYCFFFLLLLLDASSEKLILGKDPYYKDLRHGFIFPPSICICSYILHEHPNPITKRISAVPNCDWRGLSHTCRVMKPPYPYLNHLLNFFLLTRRGGGRATTGHKTIAAMKWGSFPRDRE